MKKLKRPLYLIFFLALLLFLFMIFRSPILEGFIQPLALAVWFFIRISILSIDQKISWSVIIIAAFAFILFRLNQVDIPLKQPEASDPNFYLNRIKFWRNNLVLAPGNPERKKALREELVHLLIASYAARKHIQANYAVFDAFKQREIPLPEKIYAFLFVDEPAAGRRGFHAWMNRLTGKDILTYHNNFKACVGYLEKFLEGGDEYESIE